MPHRPVVTIDPTVGVGDPRIAGVATAVVAYAIAHGADPDLVGRQYSLSRHQLLVACWFEGLIGGSYPQWKHWADRVAWPVLNVEPVDVDSIPMPQPIRSR